ncbi:MAG: tRNA (adenosine(37)-N6)-threonylcarbamoyltransferase complex transferase subunit TsaD [Candidatus Doudnabacteria bacterium]|nr:tRNA (adenosine(37)-N6)-threonylcarbamoyltransferase complex transferase subunit TsaD [bacterium]MDZ4244284.1 tRNA (adenosine(37)-N6)-threonylcarbamoyltransferase complex transferase subunit TsaD [Candidatus Doudnabacteria bacterium]
MSTKIIIVLAIETSADETSAAVLKAVRGKLELRSNVIYSQIALHRKTGGIVPEMAARAHIPKILPAIKLALKNANITLREINGIAVTAGPGLITSLMTGVDTAKALGFALNVPIIPINHLEGHLLSALPASYHLRAISFPALGLIVSGGHTMLVLVKKVGRYKILGQTVDDAAGEAFDKIAKILSLPYPGGPAIAKLAAKGNAKAFDFPRPMLEQNNFNFSFSGLKTAVLYMLMRRKIKTASHKLKADIAASVEHAIVDVLVAKTLRAAKKFKVKTILLGGGVAANQKLQQTLKRELKLNLPHSKFYIPHSKLTTDNAGMIALAAYHHASAGHFATLHKVRANPNLELKSWA